MKKTSLLILGGGPAGMSAAVEAASHGVHCHLVDENPALGGQIYRQKTGGHRPEPGHDNTLARQVESHHDHITVLRDAAAFAVLDGRKVALSQNNSTETVETDVLILAPGAYEYVPPFPGWTLPGVMTPGSAQILAKTMGVSPGKRLLLSGTGPFLLAVACSLLKVDVKIVGILEASPRWPWLTLPFRSWKNLDKWKEGWQYISQLRRAGIRIRHGRIVVAANGDNDLTSVSHAPVDGNWYPDRSRVETEHVDTLCVGYGFVPRIFLAQLAGCELEYRSEIGGWIPHRNADMSTTVPNILSVGDGAGVAGVLVASLEGRLAGLVAARRLGAIGAAELTVLRKPIDAELKRLTSFRKALDSISRIRPGLNSLVDDETIVCRCEELRWKQIQESVAFGGTNFRTLKVQSRLGMGPCQGRFCWPATARLIAGNNSCHPQDLGPASPRPPIRPVTLGALSACAGEKA
jgi:NADPH-dependent 2,4-dienoyl-CoA reductase/sulfur reductase-like enzyme